MLLILVCRGLVDVPGSLLALPAGVTHPASQLPPLSGPQSEPD